MIPAIVLAAGLSTRMGGRTKALLPLRDGRTFVQSIIDTFLAAGVPDIVVVIGHDAAAVHEHLSRTRPEARAIINPAYRSGQFSSVLTGLDAIDRPGVEAMLMTLVDIPLVASATVEQVIATFRSTHAPIVRPMREGNHGHPVLVARRLFAEVRRADPSEGAKPIVRAYASAAGDIDVSDPYAFRDIDTSEAHSRLLERVE